MRSRRARVRVALGRVRRSAPSLVIAAAAAGLAFAVARIAFGPDGGFFAPIAAVICAGLTAGARVRRAVEITVGVVLGLLAADVSVRYLGGGPVQLTVAILIVMAVAVAISGSALLANQAAVAVVVVIALVPQTGGNPLLRLADAVIGASLALALSLAFGRNVVRSLERTLTDVASGFSNALRDIASGLATGSLQNLEDSLLSLSALGHSRTDVEEAMRAARQQSFLWRVQRRRVHWTRVRALTERLDLMVSSVRGVARGSANTVRGQRPVNPELPASIEDFAQCFDDLARWVTGTASTELVRNSVLAVAARASTLPPEPGRASTTVLIGHLRTLAVDLLRATGMDQQSAIASLYEVAGPPDTM